MKVAGVDGCPGGWIAAIVDLESGDITFRGFRTFADLVKGLEDVEKIGVDIPIGLISTGSRQADLLARMLLPGRKSSVFPAPHPDVYHEQTYEGAKAKSKAAICKSLSIQSFCILPKIAEVNDLLTPELQERIFEVHPEVSFAALNGTPVLSKKGKTVGFEERFRLLEKEFGVGRIPIKLKASKVACEIKVHADDTLDAIVAAWTARRVVRGEARRVPEIAEFGFRGLRAEIVY